MDPTKQQMSDVLRALNDPKLRGAARREKRLDANRLAESRRILHELRTFLDCKNRDPDGLPCDSCRRRVTLWAAEHQSKLRLRL